MAPYRMAQKAAFRRMAPNMAPNVEKDRAFQNVTPIDTELQSVVKNDAGNVTPIVTPDVTPDKAALRIKNNHARRRKRFRFFCAPESNERKMLW